MRKIIHIDMDCFYAAVEVRDNPEFKNLPVAVGGSSQSRGVLCTCNYIARKYGIHSAMPTSQAYRLCPDLVVLPVNMDKYRAISKQIRSIFFDYTYLVETLALDEAYLDVTATTKLQGSATLIAQEIRHRIWQQHQLTASAGVSVNKFLAKVAGKINKPNGLYVLTPDKIEQFLIKLPITDLFGVGKVTATKLHAMGIHFCSQLYDISKEELVLTFGKFGGVLYNQCRGLDERDVNPNRERKSLSVETTVVEDISSFVGCIKVLHQLYERLLRRLELNQQYNQEIKNYFIKIKFNNFKQVTKELSTFPVSDISGKNEDSIEHLIIALKNIYKIHQGIPVRLIGIGVNFKSTTRSKLESTKTQLSNFSMFSHHQIEYFPELIQPSLF